MELRSGPRPSARIMDQQLSSAETEIRELINVNIKECRENYDELTSLGKKFKSSYKNYHSVCGSYMKIRISEGSLEEANELRENRSLIRDEVDQSLSLINEYINVSDKISELSSNFTDCFVTDKEPNFLPVYSKSTTTSDSCSNSKVEHYLAHQVPKKKVAFDLESELKINSSGDTFHKNIESFNHVPNAETHENIIKPLPQSVYHNTTTVTNVTHPPVPHTLPYYGTPPSINSLSHNYTRLPNYTSTASGFTNYLQQSPARAYTGINYSPANHLASNTQHFDSGHTSHTRSYNSYRATPEPNSRTTPIAGRLHHPGPFYNHAYSSQPIPDQRHLAQPPIDPASLYLIKQSLLQKPENPFNGEPHLYRAFMNQLDAKMKGIPLDPWDIILILEVHTSGKPQKIVQSHMLNGGDEPATILTDIYDELKQKFGLGTKIATTIVNRINDMQQIRSVYNIEKLEELLETCKLIKSNLNSTEELQQFNNSVGIRMLWSKLPDQFQNTWRSVCNDYRERNYQEHPPFSTFLGFVKRKVQEYSDTVYEKKITLDTKKPREFRTLKAEASSEIATQPRQIIDSCEIHNSASHTLRECKGFEKMNNEEKQEVMKKNGRCFRCLGKHLRSQCKETVECEKCNKPHLTVLHREFKNKPDNNDKSKNESQASSLCTRICGPGASNLNCSKTVLVDVSVAGNPDKRIRCYAIIDEQSSSSFADPRLAEFFNAVGPIIDYTLTTLTGMKTKQTGILLDKLKIKGVGEKKTYKLPTLMTNEGIPCNKSEIATPETVNAHSHIAHLAKFFLKTDKKADTLLLLGRDFSDGMYTRCFGQHAPFAHHTRLGWALVGRTCKDYESSDRKVLRTSVTHDHFSGDICFTANKNIKDTALTSDVFDEQSSDELIVYSREDQQFMNIVNDNIEINEEGFITMPLPLKEPNFCFPDNKQAVFARTQNCLNRVKKDSSKLEKCIAAMQGHIDAKHVELAPPKNSESMNNTWYLPVFPVCHPKKDKVRLVFDSSAKYQNVSLNDKLLTGPDLMNRLRTVLIRFRKERVGIAADIESMFYCFVLDEKDRDKSRFFWFNENDPAQKLVEFRGTRHLFGNASSPALATMGLHYAIDNPSSQAPDEVKKFVSKHFYVDDGIMSTNSEQGAVEILKKTQSCLSKYHIRLHKISSNSSEVIEQFDDKVLSKAKSTTLYSSQQTLGLSWNTNSDTLFINSEVPERPFTKRGVLATINSIYDPLGFVAPVVLTGKLIQRQLITSKNNPNAKVDGLSWDDDLPVEYLESWKKWKASLNQLSSLSIPRCYHPTNFGDPEKLELHVFSDASLDAIGYIAYLKSYNQGKTHMSMVTASSKVAPRGTSTVPRLELCAAVTASLTASSLQDIISVEKHNIFLYTDSEIVLGYLSNTHKRFSGYVTRRVCLILKQFPFSHWSFVPTDSNPADIASRPQTVSSLQDSIWFSGPELLRGDMKLTIDFNLENVNELPECIIENTSLKTHFETSTEDGITRILARVSNLNKAIRICKLATTFALYLYDKLQQRRGLQLAPRVVREDEAKNILIRNIQSIEYAEVIALLQGNRVIPATNPLFQLSPFINAYDILCVGGRLRHSSLSTNQKYPVILPKKHPITLLVLKHMHESVRHQGRIVTLGALRDAGYFIQQGSNVLKNFIKNCVTCQRLRGNFMDQIMSDLPPDRLAQVPPFENSAVDVFGPYDITDGITTRRKSATKKCWALLFTCLVSRAVHLETLPSMDITSFKNAFRRFTCIRGQCKLLRSDRGTNFVGSFNQDALATANTLEERFKEFDITWEFNPPRAPHFGGVYERKVGSIKKIIDACLLEIGPRAMTRDEFSTFICEASSIVNHTPLTAHSSNPNDPLPISPATLLMQREQRQAAPTGDFNQSDILSYGSRRWRRVQHLSEEFWRRWRQDYVQTLTSRNKWQMTKRDLKPNDIVLVKDDTCKRNLWPLARVTAVKRSQDGHVRSASLSLSSGDKSRPKTLERPIVNLILLIPSD